jgi:capsular polysaccharide biosynthesis protein
LQARLEAARLSRKAQSRGDTVRFRVIDPPRVPTEPSGPNRLLLSSIVLGVGLLAGLAVAFLMSQLRPTFDERRTLGEVTDLPVLGSVDMVWTSAQIKKRKLGNLAYTLAVMALLISFGVVMFLHFKDIKVLDHLLSVIEVN